MMAMRNKPKLGKKTRKAAKKQARKLIKEVKLLKSAATTFQANMAALSSETALAQAINVIRSTRSAAFKKSLARMGGR
jgi:hypothetical protein